jgi:hypothetical protein
MENPGSRLRGKCSVKAVIFVANKLCPKRRAIDIAFAVNATF